MTRLLVDPAIDFDDPGPVTLSATLLDPAPTLVRTFTAVDATSVVDLPAPAPADAWRLTVRRGGHIVEERTVHWGAAPSIAWGALTDVDPGSLQAVTGSPLLDLSLVELRATLLGGAGPAFDTFKELETALGDDANFAATVLAALAGKATPADVATAVAGRATPADVATAVAAQATTDAAAYQAKRGLWSALTLPIYSAHRCGANAYPENTIEAIRACIEADVDAINVDTWPLLDGGLGVIHDQALDRTTTASGNITDLSSTGVQQLVTDAGKWFGGGWGDLSVPLFSRVAVEAGYRKPLEIEAKPATGSGAALVAALTKYGLGPDTVRVSSFNLSELVAPRAAGFTTIYVIAGDSTTIPTSTVTTPGIPWVAIDMSQSVFTTQAAKNTEVARWHTAGVKVQIFTALRKADLWGWLAAGVDEVAADEPVYLKQTWKPLTSDPFASGTWYHGIIGSFGTMASSGRNAGLVGPIGYSRFSKTLAAEDFTVIGSMSPIAGAIESTLQAATLAGATLIRVGPESRPKAGKPLTIDPTGTVETVTPTGDGVLNTDGTWTVAVPALASAHAAGARVYGGTWTLTVPITFDAIGTDVTRWPGIVVGSPNDQPFKDSGAVTDNGYMVFLRANGSLNVNGRKVGALLANPPAAAAGPAVAAPLVLSAGLAIGVAITALPVTAVPVGISSGAKFVLPTGQVVITSAAVIAGATSVPIVSVTPVAAVASGGSCPNQVVVTIQRTATQLVVSYGGVAVTWADTTWFGGYLHLGMNPQTAGMQTSFGGASKITVV